MTAHTKGAISSCGIFGSSLSRILPSMGDPMGQLKIACKFDEIVDGEDMLTNLIQESTVNFSPVVPFTIYLSNVFLKED